jgi:sensor c-di-GMP phosphodiesterase-like protein
MAIRSRRLTQGAIVLLSIGAFAATAHLAYREMTEMQNRKHLADLNLRVLERAERSVDYAFIALGELVEKGIVSCEAPALAELQRQVYQRGTLKDIRVINRDGSLACSAYVETLGFDAQDMRLAHHHRSRNAGISLFRIDQKEGAALGLAWQFDTETRLVAVVSTDALLFDMLPGELRQGAEAVLRIGPAAAIARLAPSGALPAGNLVSFMVASERYPLSANLRIDLETLRNWNHDHDPLVFGGSGLVGLFFGLVLARMLTRPPDPVTALDRALAAGEFQPYLQPIFRLDTGAIVGCEALARWLRDDGSVVPPAQFIPLAEASGRIVPMTWQIIARALEELRPLLKQDKTFRVGFNIVPEHLLTPGFVAALRKRVAEARVSPRQVLLELTERQSICDLDAAARVVAELREAGFRVAIDDAGTGHNGLSYVQKLGVGTIKIDKFFVDSITHDLAARTVVEMLVRLARELGMTTVAEGVETVQQIAALAACGVDEGQGYVVSPPVPARSFLELVAERAALPRIGAAHVRVA